MVLLSMLQHVSSSWGWGRYVVFHPAGNSDVAEACNRYQELLVDQSTFSSVSIEELLDANVLPAQTTALRDRYLLRLLGPDAPPGRSPASGRTLLAYFTTGRANNGGTEAIHGITEVHRRIARGFRNPTNYRLWMILAAGRITHPDLDEPFTASRSGANLQPNGCR
jgi:Transposase